MDIILTIIILLLFNTVFIRLLIKKFPYVSEQYLWLLFSVHFLMTIVYILYAFSTASDSMNYYRVCSRSDEWLVFFKTGTQFINFLAWPLIRVLGLSYISIMIVFSYLGFTGSLLFYLSAKENIHLNPVWQKISFLEIVFLLPNLHFWSSSLGKGSCITFSVALFCFGLSRFNKRFIQILIGSFLIFYIRPHIFLILSTGIACGLLFTSVGLRTYVRWIIFIVTIIIFIAIAESVKEFTKLDSLDIVSSSALSHRASELGKASSGVDIQQYGILMKLFTFTFRPLFIDGIGVLGFLASIENVFCLIMFFIIVRSMLLFWKDWNGFFKISFFVFLFGAFVLGQVTGNLGIAMRQKAQIMPFFFIIYCKALSYYHDTKRLLPVKTPDKKP